MNINSFRALCILLPVLGCNANTVLINENFDNQPDQPQVTAYSANASPKGLAPTKATAPQASGLNGTAMKFIGSSSNSDIAFNFPAITLSKPDDYIRASFSYSSEIAPSNGTVKIMLLNSNGTQLNSNMFGVAGSSYDDYGYRVNKLLAKSNNDVQVQIMQQQDNGSPEHPGGLSKPALSNLATDSSGVEGADTRTHKISLEIRLAADSKKLTLTYTIDGNSIELPITGRHILGYTFDEVVASPATGTGTTKFLDDVLVTTNIIPN